MYVVKTGDLQILDGNYVYETVSAGGIVGEMAMVDGSPRSATVCAIKRSTVIPIDERRFLFMVQQTPFFALRVMRVMTARLRAPAEQRYVRQHGEKTTCELERLAHHER